MRARTLMREAKPVADPLALFERLTGDDPDRLLLESAAGAGRIATQSLLFVACALRIEGRGRTVRITALSDNGNAALAALSPELGRHCDLQQQPDGLSAHFAAADFKGEEQTRLAAKGPADVLRLLVHGWQGIEAAPLPLILPGVFAYDLIDGFERLPEARADNLGFADFVFWLPEQVVLVDHARGLTQVQAHAFGDQSAQETTTQLDQLADQLARPGEWDDPRGQAGRDEQALPVEPQVDMDDQAFCELVLTCKKHIAAGDVFQIVASRTFSTPCENPLGAYRELGRLNPSPYQFYLRGPDFTLFGASPETCLRIDGAPRRVEIHPIAGTRPRGLCPDGRVDDERDGRLEAELKLDHKEQAEHMMLVDLARNDVARISRPGTRRVGQLLEVERYSHVMHLCSSVSGELSASIDALAAYLASMNMGTLVGAPKIEAARLLRGYELDKRGPYGGAVGYLCSRGTMDSAIVIRSALVKNGRAHVRAGAGVVHDSIPEAEADETRKKAGAVLRAIALGGRS